jgi:hypothetical protein
VSDLSPDTLEWLKKNIITPPATVQIGERVLLTDKLENVPDPVRRRESKIEVATLDGFVEAVKFLPEQKEGIVVASYVSVAYYSGPDKEYRTRDMLVLASLQSRQGFRVGSHMTLEEAIIHVQANLADTDDKTRLLKLLGSVTASAEVQTEDDGVSQRVAAKKGLKSAWAEVQNPFNLAPFRTWTELEQPESPYILRLSGGVNAPLQALFVEVSSGAWLGEAIAETIIWLKAKLGDITIVG